jgi:hypothetical protein
MGETIRTDEVTEKEIISAINYVVKNGNVGD